jgi:hypothetical protein
MVEHPDQRQLGRPTVDREGAAELLVVVAVEPPLSEELELAEERFVDHEPVCSSTSVASTPSGTSTWNAFERRAASPVRDL